MKMIHHRSVRFAASAAVLFTLAGGSAMLAGCGSGSGSRSFSNNTGGSQAVASRQYAATFTLNDGQTAIADITAQSDGTARGTVTINSAVRSRAVLGTGNVAGTVNFSAGAVSLTGSYNNNGTVVPINVSGTVPASGTGGVATLGLGALNYSAQWVVSTPGTINGNGNNGGNASGSASDLTFSANTSNLTPNGTGLQAAAASATLQNLPYLGSLLTISAVDVVNGTSRSVSIVLSGSTIGPSSSFTLVEDDTTGVIYSEAHGTASSLKNFSSTGGTISVESVNGKEYKLRLTGVTMKANALSPGNAGTGTFTINGTITATLP